MQLVESSDSIAPTTTIACNGSPCATMNTAPVTVTLNAADNAGGWGVDKTYYTTDGSTPTTSSPIYTGSFTEAGPTTVNFFSTDLAGNTEAAEQPVLQVSTSCRWASMMPTRTSTLAVPHGSTAQHERHVVPDHERQ